MKLFTQLICPLSSDRVDENQVRVTAMGVIFTMDAFYTTGNALFPALLLVSITTLGALLSMPLLAYISGAVLVLFSFLECGLNFCTGCWLYTYVVYPLARKQND